MRRWCPMLAPLIVAMSPSTSIGNHRDVRRRSALASVVAMATGKRRRRRSARIVGGRSQRGPTERRQTESLAHSFSVPLACSFSFSLSPCACPLARSPPQSLLRWPYGSPLYIRLCFVVPYSHSAHPSVVVLSNVRVCVCMYACGDAAGGQESRVYGTHWPPQESFPESRDGGRLPALISGRFDLRIFVPFTAPSFLTILALSAPFRRVLRYGVSPVCRTQADPVQRSCPPERMFLLRQNHGKYPRAMRTGGY